MDRYIFFGTGANFSLKIFENLAAHRRLPGGIVIPEYAPFADTEQNTFELLQPRRQNPLADYAVRYSIPLHYAPRNSDMEVCKMLHGEKFEFLLVACWPYKISAVIYRAVSKAAMNLHPSLLPAYRGMTPVIDQIRNRQRQMGVSLHLLNDEFDAGDIVDRREFEAPPDPDPKKIEEIAALAGVEMFLKACRQFGKPGWHPVPQNKI